MEDRVLKLDKFGHHISFFHTKDHSRTKTPIGGCITIVCYFLVFMLFMQETLKILSPSTDNSELKSFQTLADFEHEEPVSYKDTKLMVYHVLRQTGKEKEG